MDGRGWLQGGEGTADKFFIDQLESAYHLSSVGREHGTSSFEVPAESAWLDFLHYMDWADEDVLGRQPDNKVWKFWRIFQIKCKWGKL